MSRYRLGLLAVLAVLAAGSYLSRSAEPQSIWKPAPKSVAQYPAKLSDRVYVSDKDERSFVKYYEDNSTPRFAEIDLPSGLNLEVNYSQQGVRSTWKSFYPPGKGEMKGPVRQESTFTADGTTFVVDKMYYRSGMLFQLGTLENPEKFNKIFYFPDGKLRRREVRVKNGSEWKLTWAEEFAPDNKLLETVRTLDDGTVVLRRFNPKGKVYVMVTTVVGNGTKTETWYRSDGKTPHFEVSRGPITVVTTFAKDGRTKLEERAINEGYGSVSMEVLFYDRHNRKSFGQRWVQENGQFKLAGIVTFFPNGAEKRIVSFSKNDQTGRIYLDYEQMYLFPSELGRRPYKAWSYGPDERLERYERDFGGTPPDYNKYYDAGKGPRRPVHIEPAQKRFINFKSPPPEVVEAELTEPAID